MKRNHLVYILLLTSCLTCVSCGRKSLDEQFYEDAQKETLQMCPRKIDDCTTLDSIVYDMKKRVQNHYYSFSGRMDDEALYTDNFREDIRETLLKSLRNEIKLKKQMEAGIGFGYHYYSATTHKPLMQVVFKEKDYTGPMAMRSFKERLTGKWEDYTLRNCPEQQDECTTLEEVSFDSTEMVLSYKFLLGGELDMDSLTILYPDAEKELKNMLIKNIRADEALKEEKDSGVNYHVTYFSKSTKSKLLDIKIKGKEVKKK